MTRVALILLSIILVAAGFSLGLSWSSNRSQQDAVSQARQPVANTAASRPGGQDKALLALLGTGRQVNGSAIYNFVIFNYYSAIWREYAKGAPSPSILEIGPGANLGQGVLLVATGARKYTGLDVYRDPELYNRNSYAAALELLSLVSPESIRTKADQIFSLDADNVVFNPQRVEYLFPRQSFDIGLPDGSIDFVFSHSVFEHIADPARTVAAFGKVLRNGGLSAHHFDMRDHTDFSKPIEFLKVDEASWRTRFTGGNAHRYTNRRRLSDFVKMFGEAGFKVRKVEPTATVPMSEEIRRGLHADFQEYALEDLAVVSALIVAEKP